MGRMSSLHNPLSGTTLGISVPPASRNGGADNADVNGASIDLRGKRGVLFQVSQGVTTGTAATAARIQTGDNPDDSANANWTNVNYTAFPDAHVTNQTTDNAVYEMAYVPGVYNSSALHIRAVLTPEANVALAAITHIVY